MKKNDKIIAECSGYTHDGNGVVKVDGFPLFVKGMCKGETGEIIVTMVKKTYGFGKLWRILKKSEERVTPLCPIAKQCGGCQLQHMSYKEQLQYKKQKVQDVITRIAKVDTVVNDVLGMKHYSNYRNKGQVPVGCVDNKVLTGFYRINSNTIVDTDTCMIQSERINEVLKEMRTLLSKYQNAKYFRHLLIKDGFATGEVMVVWIVRAKDFPHQKEMCKDLCDALPYIKSVVLNLNTREDNVILGERETLLFGEPTITDKIHDLKFHISSKSFYQVNPKQTEVLYGKALEFCDLKGDETIIDLYCGVGTISMFLAQKAKKVIGVEIVEAAIRDAKKNADLNNLKNIDFVCSDASTYADILQKQGLQPNVVVVDPPRKGCDKATLSSIVKMNPAKIIYVSCDPATLARDLKYLHAQNYCIDIIQPVDMFPFSFHVESIVKLVRQK
ncbi:23S rRNA (uracil(1939)-C(5))-methyltransferase RlmD [Amedibacillus sp. YH-ame6]